MPGQSEADLSTETWRCPRDAAGKGAGFDMNLGLAALQSTVSPLSVKPNRRAPIAGRGQARIRHFPAFSGKLEAFDRTASKSFAKMNRSS